MRVITKNLNSYGRASYHVLPVRIGTFYDSSLSIFFSVFFWQVDKMCGHLSVRYISCLRVLQFS